MKYSVVMLFAVLFSILSSCQNDLEKTTTYYLIRHAEKERGPEVGDNPNLAEKGLERAISWKTYFEDIDFDKVYSTDYNRTKQTAQPTAKSKSLELSFYDPSELYSDVFEDETNGKTVLIVGHSNTTPAFVNAILGEVVYENMDDDVNSSLYIVKISNGKMSHKLISVE